jgi:hypothetical protein
MFHYYDSVCIPTIDGLSGNDYQRSQALLLDAGFICGYSLLLETITVGTVTSCGFARLVDIGHSRVPRHFRDPTRLLDILNDLQNSDERGIWENAVRDWRERSALMRCAAFAAMLKAGFVFDRPLQQSFGDVSEEEKTKIYMNAFHDAGLQAALGRNLENSTDRYSKHPGLIPVQSASLNLIGSQELIRDNLGDHTDGDSKTAFKLEQTH